MCYSVYRCVFQVSPADGRVLHLGRVTSEGLLEQVKGVSYPLSRFLGEQSEEGEGEGVGSANKDESLAVRGRDLHFVTIYLSPGDYHGFHSPASWRAHTRRHFPGGRNKFCNLKNINTCCLFRRAADRGTLGSKSHARAICT